MKNKNKIKKVLTNLLFMFLIVYIVSIFYNQEKTLISYKNSNAYLKQQIEEQSKYKETLIAMKDNLSSDEYIEQIAREKLDMYLPNERIYKVYN